MELLLLAATVIALVLFAILPQRRRLKAHQELVDALRPGARVLLASGVFGTVVSLTDDRMRVEIAPGVEVEVVRRALAQIVEPPADHEPVTGSAAPEPEAGSTATTPRRTTPESAAGSPDGPSDTPESPTDPSARGPRQARSEG